MSPFLVTYSNTVIPAIVEEPLSTTVYEGSEVHLTCVFKGQRTIAWFHNGCEIDADKSDRVCIEEDTSLNNRVRSTLTILNAIKSDEGDYTCVAESMCDPVTSSPAVVEIIS